MKAYIINNGLRNGDRDEFSSRMTLLYSSLHPNDTQEYREEWCEQIMLMFMCVMF